MRPADVARPALRLEDPKTAGLPKVGKQALRCVQARPRPGRDSPLIATLALAALPAAPST